MANVINLHRARKEKERAEKAGKAAENRAAHGQSKAEKALHTTRKEKDRAALDGHRINADEPDPGAA